jgi:hypothetical protein
MGSLDATRYLGGHFNINVAALVPAADLDLVGVWAFCSSDLFNERVRVLDKKIGVTNATLGHVVYESDRWRANGMQEFPHGLPIAQSNDPTQWLFHGHPVGMTAAGAQRQLERCIGLGAP